MTQTTSDFVPVYEYAKLNDLSNQTIYRLIRESRFSPEDISVEKVLVERIRIRKSALPKYRKAGGKLSTPGQ